MIRQLIGINTTPLTLEHNIQRGSLSIEQPRAKMNIETEIPKFTKQEDPVKIRIDNTAVNESLGIYKPVAFAKKYANDGKNAVMEATANLASEGRSMMDSLGQSWPQHAIKRSGGDRGMMELETVFIPERPSIEWVGSGKVDISWTQPKLSINAEVFTRANMVYNPYKVNFSVKSWNEVEIAYNGTTSDVFKLNSEAIRKLNLKV